VMLLHQFVEVLLLVRRQFRAQFGFHLLKLVLDVRLHLVPQIADVFLSGRNDFFDALALFGRQIQFLLHAHHQLDAAEMLERKRVGIGVAAARRRS